jgi:hypothetical protein
MKAKATKALVDARVKDLVRILLDGAEPAWDICEFVREQEQQEGSHWSVAAGQKPLSYSQIRRYAAKAEGLIADSARTSRKKLRRRHEAMRLNLYAKAVSQGDIRAASAVLKDLDELLGLYPAKRTEVTGKGGAPIHPPLEAIVAALIKAEQAGVPGDAPNDAPNDEPRGDAGDGAPGAGSQVLP